MSKSNTSRIGATLPAILLALAIAAPVQAATVQRLEDIILTKARDLRRSAIG